MNVSTNCLTVDYISEGGCIGNVGQFFMSLYAREGAAAKAYLGNGMYSAYSIRLMEIS